MADQILTQEEIDALLSAMDKGDVGLKGGRKQAEAVAYSLTTQNVILRDQFYALEKVYDKFVTLLHHALSSILQRSIEVEFVAAEMVNYQEFISEFASPTDFQLFNMQPLIGSALLAVDSKLVFSLIDCMFGGDGKTATEAREFTMIEQRMIKKLNQEILSKLEEAWAILYPIKISLKKAETKPEFVHMLAPDELMVTISFSVKGEEFSGNIHLGIPYLTLEPIKSKLTAKYLQKKDMEHTWVAQLQRLLRDTPVTLIAELGRTTKTVRHLLDLHLNDVIKLNKGPEDELTITVDHVPKYMGYPGIIKGNRAVEIVSLHKKNGGES